MLPELENIGRAIGILVLSRIQVEINIILSLTSSKSHPLMTIRAPVELLAIKQLELLMLQPNNLVGLECTSEPREIYNIHTYRG
jgi:hypothetical protein